MGIQKVNDGVEGVFGAIAGARIPNNIIMQCLCVCWWQNTDVVVAYHINSTDTVDVFSVYGG